MSESGREPAKKAGAAPGQRLREERERRGLSAQKVAEDLHVDVWIVEALEAGQFHALGAPVYARGHLRKYATLLGLDGETLVLASGEQQGQEPPLVPIRPAPGTMQRVPRKSIVVIAAVVVVAAAVGWGWAEWQARTAGMGAGEATGPVTTQRTDEPAVAVGPNAQGAEVSAIAAPAAEDAPSSPVPATTTQSRAAATAEPRGYVRVRLNFRADSWVEVHDAEQRRVFADLCPANTARSLTVNAPARLAFGYPDGVQMEVNGQPVALPAGNGGVLRVILDSQGVVRAAGRQANR